MSIRTEWADAVATDVQIFLPGQFEDQYGTKNDAYALVLCGDDEFAIEGSPSELRNLLHRGLVELGKLPSG